MRDGLVGRDFARTVRETGLEWPLLDSLGRYSTLGLAGGERDFGQILDCYRSLDVRVRIVVGEREVLESEGVNVGDGRIEGHRWQGTRLAGEL